MMLPNDPAAANQAIASGWHADAKWCRVPDRSR